MNGSAMKGHSIRLHHHHQRPGSVLLIKFLQTETDRAAAGNGGDNGEPEV